MKYINDYAKKYNNTVASISVKFRFMRDYDGPCGDPLTIYSVWRVNYTSIVCGILNNVVLLWANNGKVFYASSQVTFIGNVHTIHQTHHRVEVVWITWVVSQYLCS